jgi:hypothetical protein
MSLQHYLDTMGIQTWTLKSKTQTTYALVSDEDGNMSDNAQALLQAMLASIDLNCEPVLTSEALKKQITALQPRVLFILGSRAAHQLLNCDLPIEDLRGKVHAYANLPTIVTYHPEDLLQHLKNKRGAYKDLCMVQNMLSS